MGADSAPHDVRFAVRDLRAILECGTAVVGPREFVDAGGTLHTLDAKTLSKSDAYSQVVDELLESEKECLLLRWTEAFEISAKPGQP